MFSDWEWWAEKKRHTSESELVLSLDLVGQRLVGGFVGLGGHLSSFLLQLLRLLHLLLVVVQNVATLLR